MAADLLSTHKGEKEEEWERQAESRWEKQRAG